MTILDCSVVNCAYNRDNSCRKDGIQVEGQDAHVTSETCCGSFAPKGCGCAENSAGCACKETEVRCEAAECKYNHSEKCAAEHISIAGGHADTCRETECASFCCGC